MRTLPILWRMTEDLRRLAMPSSMLFEHPWSTTSYRWTPWSQLNRLEEDLAKISKDGYKVSMKVSEFKPEELSVKVVDNSSIVIEGKSEQHHDENSYVSRNFVRRLALPQGYDADNAISTLSSDGILTVCVPNPQINKNAREIPIQCSETVTIKTSEENSGTKKDNN